ncbi:hypothetical protein HYZ80_00825 [Candidatus Parcubacteria bacterium]|nr:hypothetical protein [Candidatus Parcubacteria bacterium]
MPPDTLVGNVVSVSAAQKIIIVGDYHIENGKSVFVSSKTVHFSDATTFVQSAYVSAREPIEAGIAVSDIQERSLVRITLEPAGMAPEVLMAKRVNVLKAPNISEPPPAVKKYIP